MTEAAGPGLFVMQGVREALAAGAHHLERQVTALESAVIDNPGLAFDLSKSIIESACKTILTDRGHLVDEDLDLPKLLKETLSKLKLVPAEYAANDGVAGSLRKTLAGLQTVIQGLCELRNMEGFASHGRDAFAKQLEATQAQLAARAADTVVNFLFKTHRGYSSQELMRRVAYEDQADFNTFVDDAHEAVEIFDMSYRPSEVLFRVDQEAYKNFLADFPDGAPGDGDVGAP